MEKIHVVAGVQSGTYVVFGLFRTAVLAAEAVADAGKLPFAKEVYTFEVALNELLAEPVTFGC